MAKKSVCIYVLAITIYAALFVQRYLFINGDGSKIVVSRNGKDEVACWSGNISCQTIEFAMKKENLNNTRLVIEYGSHNLSTVIRNKFTQNFSIEGDPVSVVRCNSSQAGFYFGFGSKISIQYLTISSCGAEFPSTNMDLRGKTPKYWNISTTLFVEETKDFSMTGVNIDRSHGYGSAFYDVVGNVTMNYVTFANNSLVSHHDAGFNSGGGVYIEFKPKCNKPESKNFINSNGSFLFFKCKFLNNTAEHAKSTVSMSSCKQFVSFGRGGGISFFSRGNSRNNSLTLIDSQFHQNKALFGGGLFAELDDKTGGNRVNLKHSLFVGNIATLAGGGMRVGINSAWSNGGTTVQLSDTHFQNNYALVGGGFSEYRTEGAGKRKEQVNFQNCSFLSNKGDKAGAIMLVLCHLRMQNCTISHQTQNSIIGQDRGEAALYSYSSTVIFIGQNNFEGNEFTALMFESSYAVNKGKLLFKNNTGQEGGAVAFFGDSVLRMNPNSSMRFENNTATKRGGAIYVEMPVSSEVPMNSTELKTHSCFIFFGTDNYDIFDPDNSDTSTSFVGNVAPVASGDNVYADTLTMCRRDGELPYNNSALKWKVFHYIDGKYKDGRTTVVTSPIKIANINLEEWNAYPGLTFKPSVVLEDENYNSIYGNIRVTVHPEKPGSVKIDGQRMFLARNTIDGIKFTGSPSQKYSVLIETTIGRSVSKTIHGLKLKSCPLGYYFDKDSQVCQCISQKFDMKLGVTKCDSSADVYILKGRWGDPFKSKACEDTDFASHICPDNYCNITKEKGNVIDKKFDKSNQCTKGRNNSSPLCADCKKGYSVVFGAEFCKPCPDDYGLFWLLLVFVVITVAMIIIIALNVDTYATSLNAFLYSYQILPLCLHGNTNLDIFIKLIIGLSTLSGSGGFHEGVCLWNSMNDLEKMFLNYIIPSYMLIFTFIMIRLSYRFGNECFLNRGTVFKSFVFISVIAYSDFTRITLDLLHPIKIRGQWVVYKAASTPFFSGEHIPFAIIALVVAVFIVILFPFLIMFSFALVSLPRFVRFIGIIDTFNEPYHQLLFCDFFSVFYFFNRLVLLIIYIYIPSGALQDTIFAILCVVILLVFVYFKPYRNQGMNLYDSLLLANIAIIAIINLGLNGVYTERLALQDAAYALAYFPLFCALVKLAIWSHKKYKDTRKRQQDGMFLNFSSFLYSIKCYQGTSLVCMQKICQLSFLQVSSLFLKQDYTFLFWKLIIYNAGSRRKLSFHMCYRWQIKFLRISSE